MPTLDQLIALAGDGRWQDIFLSAGNFFFCFTLIPMLRHPGRPPLLTCIPTGLALLAGGFVLATLHLWLTSLSQIIMGLEWLLMALKKPAPHPTSVPERDPPKIQEKKKSPEFVQ
jgi:hypothetical protein